MTALRPSKTTFGIVFDRDRGCCAWCVEEIRGHRGEGFSLHHRRPAGMGGDRRPETHAPGNLVLLCGSGTTACHGLVESRRDEASERGFLIPKLAASTPSTWPIEHALHGRVFLFDDGSWEAA